MTMSPSDSEAAGGVHIAFVRELSDTEGQETEKAAATADAADRRIASFSNQSFLTDSSPNCVGNFFDKQTKYVPESDEGKDTAIDDDDSPDGGGCAAFAGLFGECYAKPECFGKEDILKDLKDLEYSEETEAGESAEEAGQDSNQEVALGDHLVLLRKSKSTKKKSKKSTRTTMNKFLPKVNLSSKKFDLIKSVLSADDNRDGKATAAIVRSKGDTAAIAAIDAGAEDGKRTIAGDVVDSTDENDSSIVTEMVKIQITPAGPPVCSDREEIDSDGMGEEVEPDADRQPQSEEPEREQDRVSEGLKWSEPIEEQSQLSFERNENSPSSIGIDAKIHRNESNESAPIVVDDKTKIVVVSEMRTNEPDAKKNEPLPEVVVKAAEAPIISRDLKIVDVGDTIETCAADSTDQGDSLISVFQLPADSKEKTASLETEVKVGNGDDSRPDFEYRQTKVTLSFKALAGLSVSRKKGKLGKGRNVKVVVTYKQNTTSSDSFTSTNVSWSNLFLYFDFEPALRHVPFFPIRSSPCQFSWRRTISITRECSLGGLGTNATTRRVHRRTCSRQVLFCLETSEGPYIIHPEPRAARRPRDPCTTKYTRRRPSSLRCPKHSRPSF